MFKNYRDLFGVSHWDHIMFAPDDGTGPGGAGTGENNATGNTGKNGGGENTETQRPNWGDAFKDEGFLSGLKGALGDVLGGLGIGKKDEQTPEPKDKNTDGSSTTEENPQKTPDQIKAEVLKEFQKEQERIGGIKNDAKAKALEFNWTAQGLLFLDKHCPTSTKEDAIKFVEEINGMINAEADARFKVSGQPGNGGKPGDPDPKVQGQKDFEARHGKK